MRCSSRAPVRVAKCHVLLQYVPGWPKGWEPPREVSASRPETHTTLNNSGTLEKLTKAFFAIHHARRLQYMSTLAIRSGRKMTVSSEPSRIMELALEHKHQIAAINTSKRRSGQDRAGLPTFHPALVGGHSAWWSLQSMALSLSHSKTCWDVVLEGTLALHLRVQPTLELGGMGRHSSLQGGAMRQDSTHLHLAHPLTKSLHS